MHLHARNHHWMVEWFYLGLICALVVLINLVARTVSEDTLILGLSFGAIAWIVGGMVCYGVDHLHSDPPARQITPLSAARREQVIGEWHCASEFMIPGAGHSFVAQYCTKRRH